MTVPPCAGRCPVVEQLTLDLARRGQPAPITRLSVGIDKPHTLQPALQGPPRMPTIPAPCNDGDYLTDHQERP